MRHCENCLSNNLGSNIILYLNSFSLPSNQDAEEVTPEERQVRLKKADSIRKMLADTQAKTTRGERDIGHEITKTESRKMRVR